MTVLEICMHASQALWHFHVVACWGFLQLDMKLADITQKASTPLNVLLLTASLWPEGLDFQPWLLFNKNAQPCSP